MRRFMETCRRAGLKATHQRREIFRQVARTTEHPDAETIYRRAKKRIPTISLDTVYRALHCLEEVGLLSRVEVLGERARFDADTRPHHHFICTTCGLVRDFYSPELDAYEVPKEVRSWGKVHSKHMEVRGVCSECLAGRRRRSGAR